MVVRCKSIRKLNNNKRIHIKDLPATIICAIHNKNYRIDESRKLVEPIADKLKAELLKIGPIGFNNGINPIGNCAENNSANYLMLKKRSIKLKDITFSKAYRPRTAQKIKRCNNCKILFD